MRYEIKVLTDDEFKQVADSDPRYSYVDDTNMGFADRERGIAFVRDTHIHDLNKYLIDHEIEELESESSTHEDPNGIRHKKFFKDLFLPFITGGLVQASAPKRAAAQTQFVEGIGNVPVSQLPLFAFAGLQPGFGGQRQQQPIPSQPSFNTPIGSQTAVNPLTQSPVSQPASASLPNSAVGSITSSISNLEKLSPNELLRNNIQNQGRLTF